MDAHQKATGAVLGSLLASSATLLCCVLPAALVSIGAGTVLVGVLSAFPQLVWLSEHKLAVFAVAGALLAASGIMVFRARQMPCPVDPVAARSCIRLRRISVALYWVSLLSFCIGAIFAFLLPMLMS
jgi:hypothetical protein